MRIDQPTMKQRSTSISSSTSTTSKDDEGKKINVEPIKMERNSKEKQRLLNTKIGRSNSTKMKSKQKDIRKCLAFGIFKII